MKHKNYRKDLLERLSDSEYAADYLKEVLSTGDLDAFFLALRNVIEARQENYTLLADRSGLSRQTLYNTLTEGCNPTLATINKILNSLEMQISIQKL